MKFADIFTAAMELAKRRGVSWAALSTDEKEILLSQARQNARSSIQFPTWVTGPSPCWTYTRSTMIPGIHGVVRVEAVWFTDECRTVDEC